MAFHRAVDETRESRSFARCLAMAIGIPSAERWSISATGLVATGRRERRSSASGVQGRQGGLGIHPHARLRIVRRQFRSERLQFRSLLGREP